MPAPVGWPRRRGPARFVALWVAAAVATAQDGLPGRAATVDGRELRGTLTIAGDGQVTVAAAAGTTSLLLTDLHTVATDRAQAPVAAPHRLWLRSGLELPVVRAGGVAAAAGQPPQLQVELPCGVAFAVPLAAVQAFRHGGAARAEPALFAADRREPPANQDLLYVQKDGKAQRSAVTITGLAPDRIDFQLRGRDYDFGWDGVAAFVCGANTGAAPDRQGKPRVAVAMTSGERLEGRLLGLDATLRLRLDEGAVLALPAAQVARLEVASDRLVWLTDLTPQAEQVPAFDRVWPWTVDRTAAGPGLQLGGVAHGRGLGMVPRTRLTYDLGGRFDVFEALVGIDDRGGPEAHAVFRVFVDGKPAFESPALTLGGAPVPVRVELGRGRQLAIEVDFGKNYDLGDFCAVAMPRVIQR